MGGNVAVVVSSRSEFICSARKAPNAPGYNACLRCLRFFSIGRAANGISLTRTMEVRAAVTHLASTLLQISYACILYSIQAVGDHKLSRRFLCDERSARLYPAHNGLVKKI